MARNPSPAFCACCSAPLGLPGALGNRPGLSQIRYRTGDFARLRQAMLLDIARHPELDALTSRNSDDYAVTLIELFAAMGDVLSFYSERIANELYLRTATDRDSVLRLLGLIGYRLRPGMAAEALLSVTLDANALTAIRKGLRVMSVPGQDEKPLFFETIEPLSADWRLNALPVFAPPAPFNPFEQGRRETPIVARPEPLGPGEPLVFFAAAGAEDKTVVDVLAARDGERLVFDPPVTAAGVAAEAGAIAKVSRTLRFFGHDAPHTYQEYLADPAIAPQNRWVTRSAGTAPYLMGFDAAAQEYPLDRAYEDLRQGARLLVDRGPGAAPRMMTASVLSTEVRPVSLGQRQDSVTWARLGRTVRGRPAALVGADGAQEALARSGVSSAMALRLGVAGQTWTDLGGVAISAPPAALGLGPGETLFLVRDGAGRLLANRRVGSNWQGWAVLGVALTSGPAAVSDRPGRIVAFARGFDFGLWALAATDGILDAWRPLRGLLTSRPVPVSWGSEHMAVFVRGADRALWTRTWTGPGMTDAAWTVWTSLGGALASEPAAASTGAGALDVVARGDDGALIHRRFQGGAWRDRVDLGGAAVGDPALVATGPDRVELYVRGTDDKLWTRARSGEIWSPWQPLGGALSSGPSVSHAAGTTLVVAEGAGGGLVVRRATAAGWGAWESPDGGLGAIADRRNTRIRELVSPMIEPRGYELSDRIAGGRATARLADAPGLASIDTGRRIVLDDGVGRHTATVTAATMIAARPGEAEDHLLVDFTPPPPRPLAGAVLRGNIVRSSHGETQGLADPRTGRVAETLGNGDATAPFQRFRLSKGPLTYLSDATSVEGTAALEVRVSGEKWTEVASLYGRKPDERVYTARQNDAGETTITFGDGRTGARVKTGAMNVEAAYRTGSGLAGRLRAAQIAIPLERPVGLREVTNPFPAAGGADAESRDKAREAGPASIRTFGRAVSLQDFEGLALSSGLVAKARATWVWRGVEKAVHLTVAGERGDALGADLLAALKSAIDAARDPNRSFVLADHCRAPVTAAVRALRDPAFAREDVARRARAALEAFFAFGARRLAEPLHASNVLSALQAVAGVRAVALDLLHFKGHAAFSAAALAARLATADAVQTHLLIQPARPRPASDAAIDPLVAACFPDGRTPRVLPAELAAVEDLSADLSVTVVEAL